MARISSTNITFIPTEGSDEIKSWKKARQEYIRILGKILIKCNESEIIQIFDDWEHQINDLERVDKNLNYMTVLLIISILHHFNRSYDQIKEHIPFTVKMLQHKSRVLNKVSSLVFKYLSIELTDNIEFLRDLMTNYILSWIESPQTRYSAMLILNVAGKFYFSTILLPNVFNITSSKFEILWNSAISDDISMRIAACKCIDAHFRGLPLVSDKKDREDVVLSIFNNCMNQFKNRQPSNHGPVLICSSIFKNSLFHLIDVPKLINALLEEVNVKSEILILSTFSLLLEIEKKMPHLFTSEIINTIFVRLVNSCQRFSSCSRLYHLIDDFIATSNSRLIPVNVIIEFLKISMKSPKYKFQQQFIFSILKTIFSIFKDVTVPSSLFLDAEPSVQYLEALRMRIPLLNDLKNTLYKHFSEGLGAKVTKNQALLSLYILKAFGYNLFNDTDSLFTQIRDLTVSRFEEVRCLVSEVLPLFQNQTALDELLVLALFDDSKSVRLSATKQLRFPEKIAHNEEFIQILDDPSLKVQRAAIPIVARVLPLNPLLFINQVSSFVEKSIRFISSSSDPRECARLSSLFPLIAEYFIPHCEAYVPQVVKMCTLFLKQRNNTNLNNENNNNENDYKNDSKETSFLNEIPTVDLSHDTFPLISNKPRFDKNCTNMRRIFQIESQEWIDIRDSNLLLTIQKIASYLSPYINEIIEIFLNIFSISNISEFVISSALDALIEIVQKIPAASDIPKTNQNLILELMTLLRKQSHTLNSITTTTEAIETAVKSATGTTTIDFDDSLISSSIESLNSSYPVLDTLSSSSSFQLSSNSSFNLAEKYKHAAFEYYNSKRIHSSNSSSYFSDNNNNNYSLASGAASIAVKVLILMGKLGVNSFPSGLTEKSTENDPLSEFDFQSSSFYTDFTISELLKLLKEPNSSIYEVITAIFVKESDTTSKFLRTIVDSFSESLTISKGMQKDILFNQLEIICYYATDKMTPYIETLLPHIINNINSIQALNVGIVLSYFLRTEFVPTIHPLFQIALQIFHKVFAPKMLPVMSKPQLAARSSGKSHFSLMNLKQLLSPSTTTTNSNSSSTENDNSSFSTTSFQSNKYKIPSITNDSIVYVETLMKFLTAAVIYQNQPVGLFVSECEQAISNILPKNNLPLSSSSMERLLIILNSLITVVQLGDASFECANITRICIRLLMTPMKNQVFQLLFSLSIYCNLSPDVIDFIVSEENMSNPSIQTLRDYLKGQVASSEKFLVKRTFVVEPKIPEYVNMLSKKHQRHPFRGIPQPPQHNNNNNNMDNGSPTNSCNSSNFSSSFSESFPKSSSTFSIASKPPTRSLLQPGGIETSKSYSSLSFSYVFKDFPPPQFRNIEKWLEDLCYAVVADSPSIAIRSCSKIVQHSPSFRRIIFPIAFLSCWRITQMNDRQAFSKAIQSIFENKNTVNPVFLKLAELLLRVGHPLLISNFIIAQACQSPTMALRFLVRHLKENPTDYHAIELILTLNMRLGRIDSSAGILKTTKIPTAGTWYEKIGDWSSALKFYMKKHQQNHKNHHNCDFDYCTTNCDFSTNEVGPILRCFANLEQWEEIRKLARLYDSMNEEEKNENAVWFAWSFYKINDLYKVYSYIKNSHDTENLNIMLFKEIFLVASDQTEKAKSNLYKIMQLLIHDCSIYSALNASQVDENLTYANYMVEIQEVLEYKNIKSKVMNDIDLSSLTNEIVKRWRRRLEYHNGDALSWLRLVEIRNLAIHTTENQKTYLKLMSVLLKKRKFEIIRAFWNEMLQVMYEPPIQILYHKIQWEIGKKRQAIHSLHLLNLLYDSDKMTIESFRGEFEKVPQIVKEKFFNDIIKSISPDEPDDIFSLNNDETVFNRFYNFADILRNKAKISQKEKGRFYRIEGAFRSQLYRKNESLENLVKTIKLFEKACSLTPEDYRNWAGFAYSASRAIITNDENINDTFVLQAMHSFLKAIQLNQSNNLVYLLQLFSLFFRYGGKVTQLGIPDEIVNLGPEVIIQILPQIVCQINHSDESVRQITHEILVRFGEKHFQALVFSLHVLITSEDREKSSIAARLLEELSLKHVKLAKEAQILVDGLLSAAVTWYEMWMMKLDAAYIESSKRNDYSTGIDLLKELFDTVNYPKCKMDLQFIETTRTPISTCLTAINQFMPVEASFHNLWYQLKRLYHFLREKFKQIESIELENVSDDLYNHRNFLLSIPGTYKVTSDEADSSLRIYQINQTLPILSTQQHPRLLYMTDVSGKKWKFLLKGHEDLRLDQRIMQFFNLINKLITSHKATSDLGVTILKYPIIPFAQKAGLISWVIGADTLHQLVMDYRKSKMIRPWAENDWINMFSNSQGFDMLSSLQKFEIWDSVSAMFPANEIYETFWEKTPDAVSWLQCVDTFSLTTALMSMAGYIIGLGDRHPSNILIQRQTGHVIHIDFGDSFEVALFRDKMPEKVPFRLTRMIVNAFGVSGYEGAFRNACVKIMHVLRENKSSIIAQLEIFVHEPIFQNKDNETSSEGKNHVLDRIIEKLNGKDPVSKVPPPQNSRSIPNSPSRRNSTNDNKDISEEDPADEMNENIFIDEEECDNEIDNDELNVEEQVDRLIKIASDPYRYVLHYIGWCQFW